MTRLPGTLRAVLLPSAALLLHLACGAGGPSPSSPSAASPAATPPSKPLNVVMIMTDDQEAVSAREMPKMQALIAAQGVTFQNAISTTPLCSPSRATVLSGRYAHSHNILSNQPPLGGYGKYRDSGMEGDSHEEEYYDFKGDPYQMNSAVGSHPSEVNRLNARMKTLAACRGASCR